LSATVPEDATMLTVTWPDGAGDLVVRQQGVDEPFTGLVAGGADTGPIAIAGGDAVTGWAAFVDYIPVGFDHILPKGLDHILFVLGLFFLSVRLGPLLWQVSAFTLAHTVTLALGALGLVTISPAIVEPLIAASIVFVAVENIFARGLNRWRPVIVFGFGLLHGLGFASVLGEYGLPDGAFLPALIGFNIGVELGQLTVIALMALALLLGTVAARAARLTGGEQVVEEYAIMFRAWSMTGSVIIALVAIWWVIERVFL
ncbi:MAG: HupE/UreJ family protein, partial [Pseudomonadota bacterium]